MPRTYNPAFEQGERRFYGVGVNVLVHVHFGFVVNGFMLTIRDTNPLQGERVRHKFIGHNQILIASKSGWGRGTP